MNIAAARRGPRPAAPRPRTRPMTMANSAGRTPRSTIAAHQATARAPVGPRQDAEELPLLARTEPRDHRRTLPPRGLRGCRRVVYSKSYECFPSAISIVILPASPASSPVPESGTTVMRQLRDAARHGAAVLEDEGAAATVQRPGDLLDRDVSGRPLDARAGGQHLALAGSLRDRRGTACRSTSGRGDFPRPGRPSPGG